MIVCSFSYQAMLLLGNNDSCVAAAVEVQRIWRGYRIRLGPSVLVPTYGTGSNVDYYHKQFVLRMLGQSGLGIVSQVSATVLAS